MDICARLHVWSFLMFLMFVLTLADGLCCACFIYPILCRCWCPEIVTSPIAWVQLSRFHLSWRLNSVSETSYVSNKKKTVDNVHKHNNCISIQKSRTFMDYFPNTFKPLILILNFSILLHSKNSLINRKYSLPSLVQQFYCFYFVR
jgi:hypothetical protein